MLWELKRRPFKCWAWTQFMWITANPIFWRLSGTQGILYVSGRSEIRSLIYINSLCHFSRGIPEWSKTFISELSSIVYHKQTLTRKFPLARNSTTCSKIIVSYEKHITWISRVTKFQFASLHTCEKAKQSRRRSFNKFKECSTSFHITYAQTLFTCTRYGAIRFNWLKFHTIFKKGNYWK